MPRTRSLSILHAAALFAVTAFPSSMSATSSYLSYDVMPKPASLQQGLGAFAIKPGLAVSLPDARSPRLVSAVLRAWKRLEAKTGVPLARSLALPGTVPVVVISVASDGGAVQGVEEDESYTLQVNAMHIEIHAATTVGALHALETLIQIAQPAVDQYVVPALEIQDSPRFPWRGLMIDCGRHFEPLPVLKRNIDAMATVKLNVFHWHLTEDQGFRMESKLYPKLTELGSDGLFYTQDDARELVRYARERGIRVVPEFEMPGHSTAWLVAYPELASGSRPDGIRREFGISNYAIDPTREETYTFLEAFLREMTTIFPDKYVHIGGDEAPAPDWKTNPRIVAFMKAHNLANNDALQAYFNQRVLAILAKLDRRMVGWDEIFNPALPKDVVVQSWRGQASLIKGAQQGYQGILSAPYYLDAMKPASVMYLADPVPANTDLTPAQQELILGGEMTMWAEHIDQRTIDSRIWPRAAAIAERFWSQQNVTNVDDMYRRIAPVSVELEAFGLQHLSSEDAGLRDLAGTEDIDALRTFASAFQPVSFSDRYKQQHTSQLTPLTSFVDAVRPDPPVRHELEAAAEELIAHPSDAASRATLQEFFEKTAAVIPAVMKQIASAPRLQPMHDRAEQLQALCATGREAVNYIGVQTAAPAGWKTAKLKQIEEAKKPSALVRFTFLEALKDLINAAP